MNRLQNAVDFHMDNEAVRSVPKAPGYDICINHHASFILRQPSAYASSIPDSRQIAARFLQILSIFLIAFTCVLCYNFREINRLENTMLLKYLIIFFVSMVPLIELRGAIPIAIGMGLPTIPSVLVCAVGNMLPVPVIYFFARRVLIWGLDKPVIGGFFRFCHGKGEKAADRLMNSQYGKFGLLAALTLFVGIPLPGTGAWTGTLGASFLKMGAKETAVSVMLGVALAACIMVAVSLGVKFAI